MTVFIISFALFALAMALMALGVLCGRGAPTGGCRPDTECRCKDPA